MASTYTEIPTPPKQNWLYVLLNEIRLAINERKAVAELVGGPLAGWEDPPEPEQYKAQSLSVLLNKYHACIEKMVTRFYWTPADTGLDTDTYGPWPPEYNWPKWKSIDDLLWSWTDGNFYPWVKAVDEDGTPSDYGDAEPTDRFLQWHILQMRSALEGLNTIAACSNSTATTGERVPFTSPASANAFFPVVYQGAGADAGAGTCKVKAYVDYFPNVAPFTEQHPEGERHPEFVYNTNHSGQDRSVEYRGGRSFTISDIGSATPKAAHYLCGGGSAANIYSNICSANGLVFRVGSSSGNDAMAGSVDREGRPWFWSVAGVSPWAGNVGGDVSWITTGSHTLAMVPDWDQEGDGNGGCYGTNTTELDFSVSGPLIVTFGYEHHL